MSVSDRKRWDAKYADKPVPDRLSPDDWLIDQAAGLPPGRALELACGLGHNAIWLALHGWQVDAVDISPAGLHRAADLASRCGARVNWIAADLDDFEPEAARYDLVLIFRFLDRQRLPGIIQQALRPEGRLIYETFSTPHVSRPDSHMKNPAFALEPGELPRLFPQFAVESYAECSLADRDVARLVAARPVSVAKTNP
ncbi:MAG: class I SAM-dependent methyltransferase [Deltaproteobacteria bacterium]